LNNRIEKIISFLEKEKIEALLVTDRSNVEYLSNFRGDGILLIIPHKANLIISDPRFIQEAYSLKDFVPKITNKKMPKFILKEVKKFRIRRIGFEENGLTYRQYTLLKEVFKDDIELVPVNFVEEIRIVKDEEEIKLIKKAIEISISAFEQVFYELETGSTEKEIANRLEYLIRDKGADSVAFESIVAVGSNASCPHAKPTSKKWGKESPLLIDWGAKIKGYNCDLTRTIFSYKINHIYKRNYEILLEAQEKAFSSIKPGIEAKKVDQIIRKFLKNYKIDKFFLHSSGHGIGKEVHEAPWISKESDYVLEENMVFTIEPAIYIKNKYGLRVEDMVRVTSCGCEVLSKKLKKWYIK